MFREDRRSHRLLQVRIRTPKTCSDVFLGERMLKKKQDNQMQHGRERERGISGWMDGWI